jgi:hypothetical protein
VFTKAFKLRSALTATGIMGAMLAYSPMNHAFDFGDMMNPGKWMGGGHDRYDDYYDGPYGGGPWGGPYGGGPWGGPDGGGPWGGPYGGAPFGGYGAGPYGRGPYGYPGAYRAPGHSSAAPRAPAAPAAKAPPSPAPNTSEIDDLERRIKALEARQQPIAPPPSDWSSTGPSDNWATAPSPSGGNQAPPPTEDWGAAPSTSDWGSAPAFRPMDKH